MPGHYYKCLMFLDSEPLLKMIDEMGGKKDDWFRQELRKAGTSAALESVEEDEEAAPPLAVLARPGDEVDELPVVPFVAKPRE